MPNLQCAALQLYSVRDMTQRDFAGTVKKVAAIGYKFVETAGYGNLKTAKEACKALDDAGLKAPASSTSSQSSPPPRRTASASASSSRTALTTRPRSTR